MNDRANTPAAQGIDDPRVQSERTEEVTAVATGHAVDI
jgi:hypothetical protein